MVKLGPVPSSARCCPSFIRIHPGRRQLLPLAVMLRKLWNNTGDTFSSQEEALVAASAEFAALKTIDERLQ